MTRQRTSIRPGPLPLALAALGAMFAASAGCGPPPERPDGLPPAYTSNKIGDPVLLEAAEAIEAWALGQTGANRKALYTRAEVLPPVPIVQPYGVGVYQQEPRLPVVLITGPGWNDLSHAEKEARAADAFNKIAGRLESVERAPPLRPTLTVQTPEGIVLSWINHLDAGGSNVHADQ